MYTGRIYQGSRDPSHNIIRSGKNLSKRVIKMGHTSTPSTSPVEYSKHSGEHEVG